MLPPLKGGVSIQTFPLIFGCYVDSVWNLIPVFKPQSWTSIFFSNLEFLTLGVVLGGAPILTPP